MTLPNPNLSLITANEFVVPDVANRAAVQLMENVNAINTALDLKANTTDVNSALNLKANITNVPAVAGSVLQVVSKVITTRSSQAITDTDSMINEMFLSITPKRNNSIFRVDVRWFGEVLHGCDVCFNITRNNTRINVPTDRIRGTGVAMPMISHFDNNTDSTPEQVIINTLDKTAGTVAGTSIEYKVMAQNTYPDSNKTMYNNRSFTDGGSYFEYGSSEIIITEIGV